MAAMFLYDGGVSEVLKKQPEFTVEYVYDDEEPSLGNKCDRVDIRPSPAAPDARGHFERGAALCDDRRYAEARVEFARAVALWESVADSPDVVENRANARRIVEGLDETLARYAQWKRDLPRIKREFLKRCGLPPNSRVPATCRVKSSNP